MKYLFKYTKKDISAYVRDSVKESGFSIKDGVLSWYSGKEKNVTIPDGVTVIGDRAFTLHNELERIILPDSVTSIGEGAFSWCMNLSDIHLSNNLVSIGENAFSFSGLKKIKIPNSVTSIGSTAFDPLKPFIEFVVYCSKGSYAEKYALEKHFKTQDILLKPNPNIDIEQFLVQDGMLLCCRKDDETVIIPEGITSVENGAFAFCHKLIQVKIPEGVSNIGKEAFRSCEKLVSIDVDKNNKMYSSCDGVLFNKNKTEIIKYPRGKREKNYKIPSSVKSIGIGAFDGCYELSSISIPDGVTEIGDWAFDGCIKLKEIQIPDSVKFIGNYAFDRFITRIKCSKESYAHNYAKEKSIKIKRSWL